MADGDNKKEGHGQNGIRRHHERQQKRCGREKQLSAQAVAVENFKNARNGDGGQQEGQRIAADLIGVGREDGADGEHEAADGGEAVADEFPPMAHDDGDGRKAADNGWDAQDGFVRKADEMRPDPVNGG